MMQTEGLLFGGGHAGDIAVLGKDYYIKAFIAFIKLIKLKNKIFVAERSIP